MASNRYEMASRFFGTLYTMLLHTLFQQLRAGN